MIPCTWKSFLLPFWGIRVLAKMGISLLSTTFLNACGCFVFLSCITRNWVPDSIPDSCSCLLPADSSLCMPFLLYLNILRLKEYRIFQAMCIYHINLKGPSGLRKAQWLNFISQRVPLYRNDVGSHSWCKQMFNFLFVVTFLNVLYDIVMLLSSGQSYTC